MRWRGTSCTSFPLVQAALLLRCTQREAEAERPRRNQPMIPGAFAYHRPKSLSEAVGLLADLGEDARPLAGGHSLIPMMKLRLAAPEHLVDLRAIAELRGIRAEGSDIVIGAMTTQHEV